MTAIQTFKEAIVWQKAHQLVLGVYEITKKFPRSEEFGLSNQMRRAAVSIPSNIAEGFKRKTIKDGIHFYNIAEGSLEELKYQMFLSKDLGYISENIFNKLDELGDETGRLLCGWKRSQRF
ncbi:MAG: four helix bundle protein [Candidatus Paceibacterota bacterium]|jgi:four helix bundle protein